MLYCLGEAKRGGPFSSILIVCSLGWVLEVGEMGQFLQMLSVITIQVELSLEETLGLPLEASFFFF